MSNETVLREQMAKLSKSLFDRGFSAGSAGNISAAVEPTLDAPARLSSAG
jgi:ribulose-5-phosphate 4-epimerase/fuculose-1-phosphate aldolase